MCQESDDLNSCDSTGMSTDAAAITQEALLTYLKSQNCAVSDRQLTRWRSEDLLPRTDHRHVIGLRGSSSKYPVGAYSQALAVHRLQSVKRHSADALRVLLWKQGYPVPPERVQTSMQRLIEDLRDELHRRGPAHWRDALAVGEHYAARFLPQLSRTLLSRQIRRRLKPQDWASFVTMEFQLLAGGIPSFEADAEHRAEDGKALEKPLAQLVVDAYGLQRAQTDTLGEAAPWLPANITQTLLKMAKQRIFRLEFVLDTLQRATPHMLEQARADQQAILVELPAVVRSAEAIFGENVFGFGMFRLLADMLPKDDATFEALMTALFLILRRIGDQPALDQISAAFHAVAPIYAHLQALLAALERELPAYAAEIAPHLSPPTTSSGGDLTPAFQARQSRLQEIAARHQDELNAFRERHPEFAVELPEVPTSPNLSDAKRS